MQDYPPIAEHGLIGDLQTAALVTTDGSIDWYCCPRFDSPSVFGSLLDAGKGGHFRIRPTAEDYVVKQLYLPDTAVLVTRFMTHDGVGRAARLHAADRDAGDRQPPAGPADALRPRPDQLRGGHRATVRLRAAVARDPCHRARCRLRQPVPLADPAHRARPGRRAAGQGEPHRGRRRARHVRAEGRPAARARAGVRGQRAAAGDPERGVRPAARRDLDASGAAGSRSRRTPAGGGRRCDGPRSR